MRFLQNDTTRVIEFLLVDSTDHVTGKTGATPVVKLSKNGAAGVAPVGVVSEVDATNHPGLYKLTPTAADVGTLGPLALHASATGCDPTDEIHEVYTNTEAADALLARNQQGGSNNAPTVSQALASGLLSIDRTGTVLTVKHGDGSVAFTRTITEAVLNAIKSAA